MASRILPVQIHDLDAEDKRLVENELGGFIRGIEFIYKEPGVNRPLTLKDNEGKNLNKTSYRNQINKVANAIKEIVSAIKHQEQKPDPTLSEISGSSVVKEKNNRIKILTGSFLALLLIILGIFFIPKLISPKEQLEKSIAVLPFENMSDNIDYGWFGDAITDEIIMHLYKVKDFTVRSRTSVLQYKGTNKSITAIGKELKVNYLVEGTAQRYEDQVRIRVQLINAVTDNHIWGETYEGKWKDILSFQSEMAKQIANKLKTVFSSEEKGLIEKNQTVNPEAYDLYLRGRYFWYKRNREDQKRSIEYFEKSVRADTNYALAYTGLADAYYYEAWAGWALPRDEDMPRLKNMH